MTLLYRGICRDDREDRLPVSTDVDGTGKMLMYAHLNTAEGGGELAPRVYFHGDTRGNTDKIHVGSMAPHRSMENTKSHCERRRAV